MSEYDYTDDQLAQGILKALRAGNMKAAMGILRLLAAQAPDKAQMILDAIEARRAAIRKSERLAESDLVGAFGAWAGDDA